MKSSLIALLLIPLVFTDSEPDDSLLYPSKLINRHPDPKDPAPDSKYATLFQKRHTDYQRADIARHFLRLERYLEAPLQRNFDQLTKNFSLKTTPWPGNIWHIANGTTKYIT